MTTDGPRRSPEAIPAALELHKQRRELYVEGPSDRLFLLYLVGGRRDDDVVVQEISAVEATRSDNKRALMDFARKLPADARVLCFADADQDRLLGNPIPTGVLLTDPRDLEGCLLQPDCFEKVVKLGTHSDAVNAEDVLNQVLAAARQIGVARVVDEIRDYKMPFSRVRPGGASVTRQRSLVFNFRRYLTSLVDQSIGRNQLQQLVDEIQTKANELREVPDRELVHGKDALDLATVVLRSCGVSKADAPKLIWTSYERRMAAGEPTLTTILEYISRSDAAA